MSQDTHAPSAPASSGCVIPEWSPPPWLTDPIVDSAEVERAIWTRSLHGAGIPKTANLVGRTLADYGNKDGSRCFPGHARLAADLDMSTRTVERAMSWLDEHGWIKLVHRGARKSGEANVYQLTLPAPVAATVHVRDGGKARRWLWNEASGPQWRERPPTAGRKASRSPAGRFLPDNRDRSTRQNEHVLPDTSGGTPGQAHQGVHHHSAKPSRPHADARGADEQPSADDDRSWLTWDNVDLVEDICEYVTDTVGEATGVDEMVERMVWNRDHPIKVLNAALKLAREHVGGW